MTKQEKEQVKTLRENGKGYGEISKLLGISKSTISTYCKAIESMEVCKNCGEILKQTNGHRQKKFCSNNCRIQYWHKHKTENSSHPDTECECGYCHKRFMTFKSYKRKYCSWECYSNFRKENKKNG